MSYVNPDYKNKKAFKQAIAEGRRHDTYSHAGIFEPPKNGTDLIEGPHYPQPHRWYASVIVRDGIVVECEKVKLGSALICAQCKATIDVTQSRMSAMRAPKAKPACKDCVTRECTERLEDRTS